MIISTKGRYALRVIIDLAEHNTDSYIPLKNIAERQDISRKYLESIMSSLSKAGLVKGVHGKGGGYRLNHPLEYYTVGNILRVTEVGLSSVSCLKSGEVTCERAEQCKTLNVWKKLDDVVNNYLDSVTVKELLDLEQYDNCKT